MPKCHRAACKRKTATVYCSRRCVGLDRVARRTRKERTRIAKIGARARWKE